MRISERGPLELVGSSTGDRLDRSRAVRVYIVATTSDLSRVRAGQHHGTAGCLRRSERGAMLSKVKASQFHSQPETLPMRRPTSKSRRPSTRPPDGVARRHFCFLMSVAVTNQTQL